MAGYVRFELENEQTLKAHSQQVADKTAHLLGFETTRKQVRILIRFKKGASHKNWLTGQWVNSQTLANMLVNGYRCRKPRHARKTGKRVPPRPVFDNYASLYSQDMKQIAVDTFNRYKGYSITERSIIAGQLIMADFKKKIYSGSLALEQNHGKYAVRKFGAGYGDIPLVATKSLFEDLEVVVV